MFPIWFFFTPYVSQDCAVRVSHFGLKYQSQRVKSGLVLELLHSSASQISGLFLQIVQFLLNTEVLYKYCRS